MLLLIAAVACLLQPGLAGTVKRKRDLEEFEMLSDFVLDDSSGDYEDYGGIEEMSLYFFVTYEKPFNDEWLVPGSEAFSQEAKSVEEELKKVTSRNLGVIITDVSVEVIGFLPGSTKAEIVVRIPEYYRFTEEDVATAVQDIEDVDTINGAPIIRVEEILPEYTQEGKKVETIIAEMVYDYDISDGSVDLANEDSEDFQNEALALRQQLTLHLVNKLSYLGFPLVPDQITIEVLEFESQGRYTKAQISVKGDDVDVEQLSYALQLLVIDNDVYINGKAIISLEELERDIAYVTEDIPEMDTKVMEDDLLNGFEEPLPPVHEEDLLPNMEVMTGKDEGLNGGLNGDSVHDDEPVPPYDEPVPPDNEPIPSEPTDEELSTLPDKVVVPEVVPVTDETIPSDDEPIPPDDEPVPPDDEPIPPEPTDPPSRCPDIEAPVRGSMDCFNDFEVGSHCQFFCDPETRMEGTDTTHCGINGEWTYDPPYCIRILCQPSVFNFPKGKYNCNNNHAYQSVCTFMCKNDEFELVGERILVCQRDETWTSDPPVCKPIPVNCDEHYGPWSECANDQRSKAEVTVLKADINTTCPEVVEACINCQLKWEPWSSCDSQDMSYRAQYVAVERVGAGKDCPEPDVEPRECRRCVLEWEDWTPCADGHRSRRQYVKVQPVGDYECPPIDEEEQECGDCVLSWGEWGDCEGGIVKRTEEIETDAFNGGAACPEPREETEDCVNCEIDWTPWDRCVGGKSVRGHVIVVEPSGRGRECPPFKDEVEDCQNCEVAWSEWTDCNESGFRERTQIIVVPKEGRGDACPAELASESERCVHCQLEWGDWESCVEGTSQRTQFVAVEAEGAGRSCDEPLMEMKECAYCELEWGEWSQCADGIRTRSQYVSQEPIEVNEPCPVLGEEEEVCIDCQYYWDDWSECNKGEQIRFMIIDIDKVGAGEPCPVVQQETRECCYLEWGPWSECFNEERTREEEVIVEPDGQDCPEPRVELQECSDCVLEWGEWSACINNNAERIQEVVHLATGGGKDCPELKTESEYCANCVVGWEPWGPCSGGERIRLEYIEEDRIGRGEDCPVLGEEREACYDCDWRWSPWSECEDGSRQRSVEILQPQVGAGEACPTDDLEIEECADCVVEWGDWTACVGGFRFREQYISVDPAGAGQACPELDSEAEECVDCVVAWREWSECSDGQRSREQYVVTEAEGAGKPCPSLGIESEACVDCVVEWDAWSICYNGITMRSQKVLIEPVGAGAPCPPLDFEKKDCSDSAADYTDGTVICRFAREVLGYGKPPYMRDLLLIGDESGSIGWVNFEKIKENFKSIARNIKGGIGSQENQIAMSSFALFSRIIFDFNDYYNVDDMVEAIDRSYYKGGYRSKIGEALIDANVWLFQQTGGMRSFPGVDDNIVHEIVIATDGCRTSNVYHLKQGLKAVKDRGIKLYVLAVETNDERCRRTVESMVEDKNDLFKVGGWADLDVFTKNITKRVCFNEADSGREEEEDEPVEEEEEEEEEDQPVEEEEEDVPIVDDGEGVAPTEPPTEEQPVVEEEEIPEEEEELPEPLEESRGDAGI